MKFRYFPYAFPVEIATSKGLINTRKGFYLEISDHERCVITEIAPLLFWSRESYEEVEKIVSEMSRKNTLIECDFPSVQFAVECALYRFKHFAESTFPVCSYHLSKTKHSKAIKLKLFNLSLYQAIALCKKTKKQFPNTHLRIDVNESWSLKEALEFAEHFSPEDFEYIEEPMPDISDLKKFIDMTQFPVALDEKLYKYSWKDLKKIGSLKALIIKPTLFGGILACQKIQKLFDCPLIFSSCYETEIGLANIHLLSRLFSPKNIAIGAGTLPCLKSSVLYERMP